MHGNASSGDELDESPLPPHPKKRSALDDTQPLWLRTGRHDAVTCRGAQHTPATARPGHRAPHTAITLPLGTHLMVFWPSLSRSMDSCSLVGSSDLRVWRLAEAAGLGWGLFLGDPTPAWCCCGSGGEGVRCRGPASAPSCAACGVGPALLRAAATRLEPALGSSGVNWPARSKQDRPQQRQRQQLCEQRAHWDRLQQCEHLEQRVHWGRLQQCVHLEQRGLHSKGSSSIAFKHGPPEANRGRPHNSACAGVYWCVSFMAAPGCSMHLQCLAHAVPLCHKPNRRGGVITCAVVGEQAAAEQMHGQSAMDEACMRTQPGTMRPAVHACAHSQGQ